MGNRILLLSGYDAASHRHWRQLLAENLPEFDWTQLALPDRHFYWRSRGNGLTFAHSHSAEVCQQYDLVIATSMVDLCTLRGFIPSLGNVPSVLYFHENQFVYPTRKPSSNLINAQLTSIYSALCADRIVFNSTYNYESFCSGAEELLHKMPDGVERGLLPSLASRMSVLPVPLQPVSVTARESQRDRDAPLEIVWNHRWEYDKQPEAFFAAMHTLKTSGVKFKLHVMGQSFRQIPDCFSSARQSLHDEISTWGYQPEKVYYQILDKADIVVSTALHDFQGLSMLEAIQRGCVPVAPRRVAYPEYVPEALLYDADGDDADNLAAKVRELLCSELPRPPDISRYETSTLIDQYRALFFAAYK